MTEPVPTPLPVPPPLTESEQETFDALWTELSAGAIAAARQYVLSRTSVRFQPFMVELVDPLYPEPEPTQLPTDPPYAEPAAA